MKYKIVFTETGEVQEMEAENLVEITNIIKNLGVPARILKSHEGEESMKDPKAERQTTPKDALVKLEKMTPEEVEEITALLEKNVLPHLQSDVSNYAKGRQRVWLPYEAPLGNQPFIPGLMDGEVWQWIVDRCAKYGFRAQVALISKGGNINPHRDTTFAAPWAMGFNLGKCDWHIASTRDAKKPDYTMNLSGGEVFKFNSKHVHAVTNALPDRWSINVWTIAEGPTADRQNISGRLERMLDENPEVQEFIELHQPGETDSNTKEDTTMKEEATMVTTPEEDAAKAEQPQEQSVNETDEKKENDVKDNSDDTPKKGGHNMIGKIKEYLVQTKLHSDEHDAPDGGLSDDIVSIGRVITNDPDYWFTKNNTFVLEEIDRGDYHFALLEHLFGNESFIVNITALTDPYLGEEQSLMITNGTTPPDDNIFGWVDFDSETMIRIKGHGNKGWTNLSEYGLVVGNSAKMTKRLVELTKSVRGYAIHGRADSRLRIKILTHEQMLQAFPYLENLETAGKPADGISLTAVETVKYVYRRNNNASKASKAKILRDIDEMKITNHTIRVLTNINGTAGLIKGNTLTSSRKKLNDRMAELGFISKGETYDIFTSVDNWKTELGTDGSFEIITLEPHHGPGMVKTNDQTMSKFWGMPGMFNPCELLEAFQVVMDKIYNDMVEGRDIQMLESVHALKARTEEEKITQITSSKVTNQVNKMAATLKGLDLPIAVSQTMMLQRANLIKKMFLSENVAEGMNWTASSKEKKSFLFMPWAYRAYIMAKEMVYMLGYDVDLSNMEAQYHAETQTIMVPGALYDQIMARLGGGDADDEVMVHIRKMICKDGSIRLVAVLIRTPDDWGEYWIIDVDINAMGPVFLAEEDGIELPTIYEEDFDKFNHSSSCGQLPSAINGSNRPNTEVWNWESSRYNWAASQYKGQSVGGQVKTKMLYYSTFNAPFETLPCANEDMIDALQQCKGTMEDLIVLNEWASCTTAQMLSEVRFDAYWWQSRNMRKTARALQEAEYLGEYLGSLPAYESPIVVELMVPRERMVRETYSKMLEWLNNNIMEIPELARCIHKDNQMKFRKLVTDLNKTFLIPESMMYDEMGNRRRLSKAERSEHFDNAAKAVAERFASYKERLNDDVKFHKFVLSLVRMSWIMKTEAIAKSYDMKNPRHNYDRWLYTAVSDADTIITDYFFEAMLWFRETYKNK